MNIETLRAVIAKRGGIARPNRWSMMMTAPAVLGNRHSAQMRDVSVLCETVSIPGQQIQTTDHYTTMKAIKKPTQYINDDIEITCNVTADWFPWSFFDEWMRHIIVRRDPGSGTYGIDTGSFGVAYKSEYTSTIDITPLGGSGSAPVGRIRVINAWPVTLGTVALGNADVNSVAQIQVSFAYDDWYAER